MKRFYLALIVLAFSTSAVASSNCPWWKFGCLPVSVSERPVPPRSRPLRTPAIAVQMLCHDPQSLWRCDTYPWSPAPICFEDSIEMCPENQNCLVDPAVGKAACIKTLPTTMCNGKEYKVVKPKFEDKIIVEHLIKCEDETECLMGQCVPKLAPKCQDSDTTIVANGKPDWKSIITPGHVTLATGKNVTDLCKDDNLLQEQYCDASDIKNVIPKMAYVGCKAIDLSGKCQSDCIKKEMVQGEEKCVSYIAKCAFGVLTNDKDNDDVPDAFDNCPSTFNEDQVDADADGVGDVCDNCMLFANPYQTDSDKDDIGDACDCEEVAAMYLGLFTSCATLKNGDLRCWGNNMYGQVGDGSKMDRPLPVKVPEISFVKSVAHSNVSTCALLQDETVACWGNNGAGTLGDGTFQEHLTPKAVKGLAGVQAIVAGAVHFCALVQPAGAVYCWGGNPYGQLGNGTTTKSALPINVSGLVNVKELVAVIYEVCALMQNGGVKCWGNLVKTPTDVPGITSAQHLHMKATEYAGLAVSACVLTDQATVQCWGDNLYGQLGDGTKVSKQAAVTVQNEQGGPLTTVKDLSVGLASRCARLMDGSVYCWGSDYGAIGNWKISEISAVANAVQVFVSPTTLGVSFSYAIMPDATVSRWIGGTTYSLKKLQGLNNPQTLMGGEGSTCALQAGGNVMCWGKFTGTGSCDVTVKDPLPVNFCPVEPPTCPVVP